MTLSLERLLERGYFPQELPPPFNTKSLATFIAQYSEKSLPFLSNKRIRTSKPEIYNLARTGTLRRELSILNPIHFTFLANCIAHNWKELEKASSKSRLSLTTPTLDNRLRAIGRKNSLDVLPSKRAELRSRGRFLLKADVVRFYPSVYTHSIPWALHGKRKAKENRSKGLLGNEIDELMRNCQDGQTNGIPVGPDTSLVLAEILLNQVDQNLSHRKLHGLRYIDDYELVFDSEADALAALSKLEESLLEFELHLNPSKTRVFPLPQRLEDSWVAEIKNMELSPDSRRIKGQLIRFFDRAFELARSFPTENVLKYAAGRIGKMRLWRTQQELVEDLLVQCARVEAGALPAVFASILRTTKRSSRRTRLLRDMLHNIITEHAPQRHSSEVAWSLWACISQKLQLPSKLVRHVLRMEDSVCTLLLLHARSLGLLDKRIDLNELRAVSGTEELYGNRWLLAYEGNIKGWLPASPKRDHVADDHNFGLLKKAEVSFYDENETALAPTDEREEEHEDESYFDRYIRDYYGSEEDDTDFEDEEDEEDEEDDEEL
ncbi:MAG TPA: RNA-directed DNA polymerase [Nitrospira sp.]|nr:RNA-directed DNA polymerase [Nitrospira sp.]